MCSKRVITFDVTTNSWYLLWVPELQKHCSEVLKVLVKWLSSHYSLHFISLELDNGSNTNSVTLHLSFFYSLFTVSGSPDIVLSVFEKKKEISFDKLVSQEHDRRSSILPIFLLIELPVSQLLKLLLVLLNWKKKSFSLFLCAIKY